MKSNFHKWLWIKEEMNYEEVFLDICGQKIELDNVIEIVPLSTRPANTIAFYLVYSHKIYSFCSNDIVLPVKTFKRMLAIIDNKRLQKS